MENYETESTEKSKDACMAFANTNGIAFFEIFLSYNDDESAEKSWLCAYGHCLNEEQKRIELNRLREIHENKSL